MIYSLFVIPAVLWAGFENPSFIPLPWWERARVRGLIFRPSLFVWAGIQKQ
jgi:hypothetical protein